MIATTRTRRRLAVALALALTASITLGCDDGGEGETVTYEPAAATVVIGPDGGTVEAGVLRLEIPAGALESDTEIQVSSDGMGPSFDVSPLGPAFTLQPHGLRLAVPATLTLDVPVDADDESAVIIWTPDSPVEWTILSDARVEDGSLVADIDHFSTYAGATLDTLSRCVGLSIGSLGVSWSGNGECTKQGQTDDRLIRWGVTEYLPASLSGDDAEKQPAVNIELFNQSTGHIKLLSMDVRNAVNVQSIDAGERYAPLLDDVAHGWLPEFNQYTPEWEASVQAVYDNPDADEWTSSDWIYFPAAVGVDPEDPDQPMSFDFCFEYVVLTGEGLEEGQECITYSYLFDNPCESPQIPSPATGECGDWMLVEDCSDVYDGDGDGLDDFADPDCETPPDPCDDHSNWTVEVTPTAPMASTYTLYDINTLPGERWGCRCTRPDYTPWECEATEVGGGELNYAVSGRIQDTYLVLEVTRDPTPPLPRSSDYPVCELEMLPRELVLTRGCFSLNVASNPVPDLNVVLSSGPCEAPVGGSATFWLEETRELEAGSSETTIRIEHTPLFHSGLPRPTGYGCNDVDGCRTLVEDPLEMLVDVTLSCSATAP